MKPRQIQREAVIESHACPTCHRRAGYPCQDTWARTVTTHEARVAVGLSDERLRAQCASTSPSGTRCQLPDLGWWHRRGHRAFPTAQTTRTWQTDELDAQRWRGQVAEVEEPLADPREGTPRLRLLTAATFLAVTGASVASSPPPASGTRHDPQVTDRTVT